MQDLNFNKEGKLPQDIENEKYYDVNISGSAIKNCEIIGNTPILMSLRSVHLLNSFISYHSRRKTS